MLASDQIVPFLLRAGKKQVVSEQLTRIGETPKRRRPMNPYSMPRSTTAFGVLNRIAYPGRDVFSPGLFVLLFPTVDRVAHLRIEPDPERQGPNH